MDNFLDKCIYSKYFNKLTNDKFECYQIQKKIILAMHEIDKNMIKSSSNITKMNKEIENLKNSSNIVTEMSKEIFDLKKEVEDLKKSLVKLSKKKVLKKQIKYIKSESNDKLKEFNDFDFDKLLKKGITWHTIINLDYLVLFHMIIHGKNMNCFDNIGESFLYCLCQCHGLLEHHSELLDIIDAKFNLELVDGKNQRPIHYAYKNGNTLLFNYLIKKQVTIDYDDEGMMDFMCTQMRKFVSN